MVAWGQRDDQGAEREFLWEGGDGNVCYIDYDDGFTDVYVSMHDYVKTPHCAL